MIKLNSHPLFLNCRKYAKLLEYETGLNYETANIDTLANGYCKAIDEDDESNKNKYFSALMLRFWYQISRLQSKSPNIKADYNEFVAWLQEAINYACKYRAWQNPEKHCNAQQAINQCINTIRLQHYYDMNLARNKVNQVAVSLDQALDDDGKTSAIDLVQDPSALDFVEQSKADGAVYGIVKHYLNNNKVVEGIILNTIAFEDCEREVKTIKNIIDEKGEDKKITTVSSEFYPRKCVNILTHLPTAFISSFSKAYDINEEKVKSAYLTLTTSNNAKVSRMVKKTLENARTVVRAY